MSLRIGLPLAAIAIAVGAGSAQAIFVLGNGDSRPLTDILNSTDRKFQVGDKIFTVLAFTSSAMPPATISVQGFIASNPLTGVGFDLVGNMGDTPGDGIINDIAVRYTVEVDPTFYNNGYRIVDTGLAFNGSASGTGSYARVDESIFNFDTSALLGTRSAFALAGPPPVSQLTDNQNLPGTAGYRKLDIVKDIQFFAVTPNGASGASFVRQTFSQIPAPGAAALCGMGGLLMFRRRR